MSADPAQVTAARAGHAMRACRMGKNARDASVRDVPNTAHPNAFPAQEQYRERSSSLPGAVVWTRETVGATDARVLPDGSMDLLWIDGRLAVAGPDTRAYVLSVGPATRIAGIRFFPGSAPALLGIPAHELRDGRADLADIWAPADVRRANDLLARAGHPAAGLEEIARWRAADAAVPDPLLHAIVSQLRAGESVSALADSLELGARRLHRLSLTAFGYGPKTLARILRMQRALALARTGTAFAEVAARTGYADQPHLSREIRALTGLSLTGVTRARPAQP
ncbi:helix-turn-helix domain-containing protein [Nocardia inohanensis]|uniref:helix-turn-helix domain-containing protein n=1 Tax=Nocardia inohanensis TaxID=209246 RepID=UPI000B2939BB|nr:helix-turn-helix domain-containing protein [Nocardia inohanensis]